MDKFDEQHERLEKSIEAQKKTIEEQKASLERIEAIVNKMAACASDPVSRQKTSLEREDAPAKRTAAIADVLDNNHNHARNRGETLAEAVTRTEALVAEVASSVGAFEKSSRKMMRFTLIGTALIFASVGSILYRVRKNTAQEPAKLNNTGRLTSKDI